MEMAVEETRLFGGIGEPGVAAEDGVEPAGSGAGWSDDEERGELAGIDFEGAGVGGGECWIVRLALTGHGRGIPRNDAFKPEGEPQHALRLPCACCAGARGKSSTFMKWL